MYPQGRMSHHFREMRVGDYMEVKGPKVKKPFTLHPLKYYCFIEYVRISWNLYWYDILVGFKTIHDMLSRFRVTSCIVISWFYIIIAARTICHNLLDVVSSYLTGTTCHNVSVIAPNITIPESKICKCAPNFCKYVCINKDELGIPFYPLNWK